MKIKDFSFFYALLSRDLAWKNYVLGFHVCVEKGYKMRIKSITAKAIEIEC